MCGEPDTVGEKQNVRDGAHLADGVRQSATPLHSSAQVEDTAEQFKTVLKAGGIMDTVEEVSSTMQMLLGAACFEPAQTPHCWLWR